jgi:non-canonical (house-cleaning) NTP pyrophosphatase
MADVIVASTSPHKLHAAYCVMQRTVLGVASESGVAEQPVGLDETTRGARNRMRSVLEVRCLLVYAVCAMRIQCTQFT